MQVKKLYAGRIIDLNLERIDLPNGKQCELEIIHHPGGVAIVAINAAQQLCLVHQFRHAAGGYIWELPAGKMEPPEDRAITARRELEEEAGMQAAQWTYLGQSLSSPGCFTEVIHLYLAEQLTPVEQRLEDNEILEVHWFDINQVREMLLQDKITDAKTLVGLMYLQRARPDLALL